MSETVVESDGDSDGEENGDDDDADVDVDSVPPTPKIPDGRVAAAVGDDVAVVVVVLVLGVVVVLVVDDVGDGIGRNIPRRRLARLVDPRVLLYTLCRFLSRSVLRLLLLFCDADLDVAAAVAADSDDAVDAAPPAKRVQQAIMALDDFISELITYAYAYTGAYVCLASRTLHHQNTRAIEYFCLFRSKEQCEC